VILYKLLARTLGLQREVLQKPPSFLTVIDRQATMRSCFGRFAGYQKLEDQESQLQEPERGCLGQWPTKRPRFTKPGWTTICLILVDLALFGLLLYSIRDLFFLLRHNKEMFSAHVNVTLQDQPKHVHSSRQIPRILHQTCKNETIPEMWAESQQSCLKAYSDFEYKVRLIAHYQPLVETNRRLT
jgi:hypothetical protein